jgi:hypothetical protein
MMESPRRDIASGEPSRHEGRRDSLEFKSFVFAGFECSNHRLPSGRRLDLIESTRHEEFCDPDYRRLHELGIRVVREGVRWHLVDCGGGRYEFGSLRKVIDAALKYETQIIWDLFHYGYPDGVDIFSSAFIKRYAEYVTACCHFLGDSIPSKPFLFTPINELSFFSWAGGDTAFLNPGMTGRGGELKRQLVRAYVEGIEAIWSVFPDARIISIDPIIHIAVHPDYPTDRQHVHEYNLSQFQAWDMLGGRLSPELGGKPEYLDILGVNYYWNNQWIHRGGPISRFHPLYRPFRALLREVSQRYGRPLIIGETGTENDHRPYWLRHICREVRAARRSGVDLRGMCLYPIVNHPGWVNDRHCHNGLWDYPDEAGEREVYEPFKQELIAQMRMFEREGRSQEDDCRQVGINHEAKSKTEDNYAASTLRSAA